MSDASIYGENDRDFHSPFDLGFDPAAFETLKWLLLGHLLFLVGLIVVLLGGVQMGNVWITPLFGLPLLWAARKKPDWIRIAVFVVGFTAAHYLAVKLAVESFDPSSPMWPGLVGGAIGAAGSLLLCVVCKLVRPGAATLVFAGFGALLLAGVGSMGVYMYLTVHGSGGFIDRLVRMLWVYVPWQLIFAYVLAKSLKPIEG